MNSHKIISTFQDFRRSEGGAIGITLAVAAPVIIGIAGLAVDYNVWKKEQTALVRVTESAAMAAGYAKSKGADDLHAYALADAKKNGFDDSRETLSVNYSAGTISVDIERQSDRYLSSIITQSDVILTAEAQVELVDSTQTVITESGGYACITALDSDPTQDRGVYMHDSAEIHATDCGVFSNATDLQQQSWVEKGSIYLRNASIDADYVRGVGDVVVNDWNGNSSTSVEPESGAGEFIDPFAELEAPVAGSCDNNGQTVNWVATAAELQPGTYCGDIIIQNGGKAKFAPGVYNIVDGDFRVRGGATISDSDGVTFYFGGNTPGKWVIDNDADMTLSAPANGDTAGMLFWQSDEVSCNTGWDGQNKFAGGADFKFDGVIYAPNCGLVIDNNAQLSPSNTNAHMSIHAAWIEMRGSTSITAYGAPAEAALVTETGFTNPTTSEDPISSLTPHLTFAN